MPREITSSVADLGCLSRIMIVVHPGYNHSNKRGGGKTWLSFFCSHKYHKIEEKKLVLNR
jgi:hypothetical protein